jgi:uncharacterized protein
MAIMQQIPVDEAVLDAFCKQWKIVKLEMFDASWRSFDADLHLLVTVAPDANWGLLEHNRVEWELGELLGRSVELVSRRAIESNGNALSRRGILESARPLYPQ